jgi:hypothetical protein
VIGYVAVAVLSAAVGAGAGVMYAATVLTRRVDGLGLPDDVLERLRLLDLARVLRAMRR